MLTTVVSSFIAFASTNVDDIFILMALFSQTRAQVPGTGGESGAAAVQACNGGKSAAAAVQTSGMTGRHIILGQYLGFAALVALSVIGALSSFFIPVPWIGLLGFVPIYMGVKGLLALRSSDSNDEGEEVSGAASVLKVAAITFANGGDNIAIYIPIFASQTLGGNIVTLAIFFIMLALWCLLAYKLVKAPVVAKVLQKYGHIAVPFVLIGLGAFILYHSGSFGLLSFS